VRITAAKATNTSKNLSGASGVAASGRTGRAEATDGEAKPQARSVDIGVLNIVP
jgi:hypothetical protein